MIVGFSITKMNAEKHAAKQRDLNVNYTHKITDVETAEVPAIDKPIARVHFTLDASYTQNEEPVADMGFEGTLLWQGDAEDLVSTWDEEDTIDDEVAAAITNHLYRKCLTQAVSLADTLDLPSPVPMPRIGQQQ